jgi:hypothetical protein
MSSFSLDLVDIISVSIHYSSSIKKVENTGLHIKMVGRFARVRHSGFEYQHP